MMSGEGWGRDIITNKQIGYEFFILEESRHKFIYLKVIEN